MRPGADAGYNKTTTRGRNLLSKYVAQMKASSGSGAPRAAAASARTNEEYHAAELSAANEARAAALAEREALQKALDDLKAERRADKKGLKKQLRVKKGVDDKGQREHKEKSTQKKEPKEKREKKKKGTAAAKGAAQAASAAVPSAAAPVVGTAPATAASAGSATVSMALAVIRAHPRGVEVVAMERKRLAKHLQCKFVSSPFARAATIYPAVQQRDSPIIHFISGVPCV